MEKFLKKQLPLEGVFSLFLLFSLTLGLGIFVAFKLNEFFGIQEKKIEPVSFWQFLGNFFLALFLVLVILFLGKRLKKRKKNLLKVLFLFTTGLGSLISLELLFGEPVALVLVLILIFLWLKSPCILFQNILVILGIAGASGFLGTKMNPETVVLLLILFSIYDYISVYKTKHMIKMAKEMIKEGVILGLILPKKISDFKAPSNEVVPGGKKFFVLGGGDIAFPLILCSALVGEGLFNSLIVALFSLFGLFFSLWLFFSQRIQKPIPALPPIALFSIIGYLITKVL